MEGKTEPGVQMQSALPKAPVHPRAVKAQAAAPTAIQPEGLVPIEAVPRVRGREALQRVAESSKSPSPRLELPLYMPPPPPTPATDSIL